MRTRSQVPLVFWFCLGLLMLCSPCGARAQVASTCGPGKSCNVRLLKTTLNSASQAPVCMVNPVGSYNLGLTTTGALTYGMRLYSDAQCLTSAADVFIYDLGGSTISFPTKVRTPDGTAALPMLAPSSDPNSGVYSCGADCLGVSTAGVASLVFRSTAGYLSSPGLNSNIIATETLASIGNATNTFNCTNANCSATTGIATGATGTGTAFASFPACNAAAASRVLYDSTNAVLRVCNAAAWVRMANHWTLAATWPAGTVKGTDLVLNESQPANAAISTAIVATVLVAGVGAGTYTVQVFNVTTATSLCVTTAKTCSDAVQTQALTSGCTGVVNAGDKVRIRITDTGCATSPVLSISAQFVGN